MRVLLIFVDGLGIGKRGPANPLHGLEDSSPLGIFADEEPDLPFDGVLIRTDPTLGVTGRPQSASGQTTILTGVNAATALGYHKQGFPNERLLEIIRTKSIFLQLKQLGFQEITFANAYTEKFFTAQPRWISATTAAVRAANLRFRTLDDLRAGRAVYQDFTNSHLLSRGETVELRSAEDAGSILASISADHSFTLYEYFITDTVGHAQDFDLARRVLGDLARFVRSVLSNVNLAETTVMLTSDHGNIEDLSTRSHTINPVPTIVWGANRKIIAGSVRSLVDITPSIVQLLSSQVSVT